MHVDQLWPSKYVKAQDLDGRTVTVTIREVKIEEMTNNEQKVKKPVLYFNEAEKALILNKTNGRTIAALYGPETNNWTGQRITLFTKQIKYFEKMQLCIRVKGELPDAQPF